MQKGNLEKYAPDPDKGPYLLGKMRSAIAVAHYLNMQTVPNANERLTTVVNNVGEQLRHAQTVWNQQHPNEPVKIVEYWREWIKDYHTALIRRIRDGCKKIIAEMTKWWGVQTGETALQVLEAMAKMSVELDQLVIKVSDFD